MELFPRGVPFFLYRDSQVATLHPQLRLLLGKGGAFMMKKMSLFALTAALFLTILGGCSDRVLSYAGVLIVNDQIYVWQGDLTDNEYTPGAKLGEVQEKVDVSVFPRDNFSSNILETGEEIFAVDGEDTIVIVKREDGGYDKFTVRVD